MLDRSQFLRPIAHRGLHDPSRGIVENTEPAFAAAIARGYGIECDLRAAAGGVPIVFHDDTLERLIEGTGPVASLDLPALKKLQHKTSGAKIMTYGELLELAAGRVPLLVEVKGEWTPPDLRFLRQIASLTLAYRGPVALMSFDPAIVAALAELAPGIARGIVSGSYRRGDAEGWWDEHLTPERQERLSHLLESAPAYPDFYAYQVQALPTPVTRFVREVLGMPLLTWTVRTPEDMARARAHADAPIFEGFLP